MQPKLPKQETANSKYFSHFELWIIFSHFGTRLNPLTAIVWPLIHVGNFTLIQTLLTCWLVAYSWANPFKAGAQSQ